MLSNRLVFAALAIACIGAAAGGGYIASRQNAVPAVTQAASTPPTPSSQATPALPTATPVQETEAIVGEPAGKAASATSSPSTSATASRRVESPSPDAAPAQTAARPARPRVAATRTSDPLPTLEKPWPSGAATTSGPASSQNAPAATTPAEAGAPPRVEDRVAQDPPRAPEPPQKLFEELVVTADSVIGLQAETTVTSDRARVEDRVEARVTRDVRVRDMVAIPAGSRALGSVVSVERGGKFRERARLGIRFNTLVLADGTRLPISTDTIYREGDGPGKDSAAKMTGAAVGGAILGAILGGGKGAAIGGAVGAGAGAAGVMAADRTEATLASGQQFTVRIVAPVTVTIEQK